MTVRMTPAARRELVSSYYRNPDEPQYLYGMEDRLVEVGYLTRVQDDGPRAPYRLTPIGSAYIHDIRQAVSQGDALKLDMGEREGLIQALDPEDETDAGILLDLALNDRSDWLRESAALILHRHEVKDVDWDRFALDRDPKVRETAALHADVRLFRDETSRSVVQVLLHYRKDEVPDSLILAWLDSGSEEVRSEAAEIAPVEGIPRMVGDPLLAPIAAERFTEEQLGDGIEGILSDFPAACNLAYYGHRLTDATLERLQGVCPAAMEARLREYRDLYREFRDYERDLFADPDGEVARRQRRLALSEGGEGR